MSIKQAEKIEKEKTLSGELPTIGELFKAGAHFGHRKETSDARSNDFVYTYRNRVCVIDLEQTKETLSKALRFLADEAKRGANFLFVGTKIQAREAVKKTAESLKMPYIIERWPGGLLTNYEIVGKTIKKMKETEKNLSENKYEHLTKKERLKIEKDLNKIKIIFGGLGSLEKKPDVIIIVDAKNELIAVREAQKSSINTVALCDTNANPKIIDFPIVANDDSRATIELVLNLIEATIQKNFKSKVEPAKLTEEDLSKKKAAKKLNDYSSKE